MIFMSSLNVRITSVYYRSFSPGFSLEDQCYTAQKGFDCAPRHCQQLSEEPRHCCSILPFLVPNSIPVILLEQGMLVSSLFWAENILLSKSKSISYLLLVIYFILLKICTKPWLGRLSNPLKCFLLKNQACISTDPPLLHPPKLKL